MAKGRNLRSRPAGGRDADGLRPGRDLDPRRAVRRGLPHRPPVLFLPQGRSGRGRGAVVVRGWEAVVRPEGCLSEVICPSSFRGARSANPESRDSGFAAYAAPRNDNGRATTAPLTLP